jgi:hypothetical protein
MCEKESHSKDWNATLMSLKIVDRQMSWAEFFTLAQSITSFESPITCSFRFLASFFCGLEQGPHGLLKDFRINIKEIMLSRFLWMFKLLTN